MHVCMQAKRRRRKRRNAGATGELAEGTGDVQPRCDAKAAPSDVKEKSNDAALEGEDEVMAFSELTQSCLMSDNTHLVWVCCARHACKRLWCL